MNLRRITVLAICSWLLPMPVRAGDKDADDLAKYDARIKPIYREHWAYQPIAKPTPPKVSDTAWVRNPIDAFILAELEKKGWTPNPAAAPEALLRRLHLDLTGLPPTLEERRAFLKNPSPDALDNVARELLQRLTYGERWGRHWLDVVRYADSSGYERDAAKPSVWRYRDYVIRAFNNDKPFDRFILEQIAGDELPGANAETLIATGFHRLGPWDDEPADPKEDRFDQLDDIISTTSLAFLGLTVGCARCHDHKFDAITIHDYYRLAAVFAPLERPRSGRTELDVPLGSPEELKLQEARDRRIAEMLKTAPKDGPARAKVEQDIAAIKKRTPDLPRGYFMVEPPGKVPHTRLLLRGKASNPGPIVQPGVPAVLVDKQPVFPEAGTKTSQRRLTLARWIASPKNPLTARVIVNRVWQYHFGQGIVTTPSDFGVLGQPPSHPELLDWLASRFIEDGWSIHKLHHLIIGSNTYRMSKRVNADYVKFDPENRLWWRFPYRRLEVEAIRDSVLAVSGQLNPKSFGPSMFPPIAKEVLAGNSDLERIWRVSDEKKASRRTVYAFVKRGLVVPMLEVFDFCDTTHSNDRRLTTTVATQALNLFNSDFTITQARHLAARLENEVGEDPVRQIERLFELALCRLPSERERSAMQAFLKNQQARSSRDAKAAQRDALTQLCRVVFNLNEFVYPD